MENEELLKAIEKMVGTLRDELVERISDTETRMLRAFCLIARKTAYRQSELERRFNEFTHPPRQ